MLAPSVTSGLPLVLLYAEAKLQQFIFHQFTEYNSMQVIVTALSAYFIGVRMRHLLAELSVLLPVPHTCVYMVVVRCALFRTNVLALPGMFCEHRLSGSKCPSFVTSPGFSPPVCMCRHWRDLSCHRRSVPHTLPVLLVVHLCYY